MFSICYNSRVKSWRNKNRPQRITKIKPFINEYKWEGVNFPSENDDWKKIEKINVTTALYVLYAKKEKNIYPAYASKHSSHRGKQVILLMIPNGEKCEAKSEGWWHYLAVKKTISIIKRNNV